MHPDIVSALQMDNGTDTLATACFDKIIRTYSLKHGGLQRQISGHQDCVVSLSLSGPLLMSGSLDGEVRMWSLGSVGNANDEPASEPMSARRESVAMSARRESAAGSGLVSAKNLLRRTSTSAFSFDHGVEHIKYTQELLTVLRPGVATHNKMLGPALGVAISRANGVAVSLSAGAAANEASMLIVWESYEDQQERAARTVQKRAKKRWGGAHLKMTCWIVIQQAVRVKVARIRREKEQRLQRAGKKVMATNAVRTGGSQRAIGSFEAAGGVLASPHATHGGGEGTRRYMVEPVGGP